MAVYNLYIIVSQRKSPKTRNPYSPMIQFSRNEATSACRWRWPQSPRSLDNPHRRRSGSPPNRRTSSLPKYISFRWLRFVRAPRDIQHQLRLCSLPSPQTSSRFWRLSPPGQELGKRRCCFSFLGETRLQWWNCREARRMRSSCLGGG